MDQAGAVNTYLIEIFKNHKLIKIFQKESYETARADGALKILMDKGKKLNEIYARSSPIMEVLTGIMIAILIFYSGNLIIQDELGINNFFSLTFESICKLGNSLINLLKKGITVAT